MDTWISPIKGRFWLLINQLLTIYQSVHITSFPLNESRNQTEPVSFNLFTFFFRKIKFGTIFAKKTHTSSLLWLKFTYRKFSSCISCNHFHIQIVVQCFTHTHTHTHTFVYGFLAYVILYYIPLSYSTFFFLSLSLIS